MGLRIQNNITALNAHRHLTNSDAMMSKSLERLSSGYRINKAADDAAGLAISTVKRTDIAAMQQGARNLAQATADVQSAEGSYEQISNILVRLKELATQASSSTSDGNKDKINAEATELTAEITRIGTSTAAGGTYTVGDGSQISFSVAAVTLSDLGLGSIDLSSASGADTAITAIDTAVGTLSTNRATLGAAQNRLGYAAANLATTIENEQASESIIRDVDMAAEMTSFTKSQILMQAGTAMLAQANMSSQSVLSLIG